MRIKAPGVTAYAAMLLWLVLTATAPMRADAYEIEARRAADFVPEIAAALADKGVRATRIDLSDPDAALFLVDGEIPRLEITAFDSETGRFSASISADGRAHSIDGTARADRLAAAPDRAAAPAVRKGTAVAMTYESAGLKVTHMGVALQSGIAGALIDVKNFKSDRVMKAQVVSEGLVAVLSPKNTLTQPRPETIR